jgi:hypothetical protein
MKTTLLEQLCRITVVAGVIIVSNNAIAKSIQAQEVDWDSLCQKFPENSRCQEGRPETIKIQLADSGAKDEWIRIDKVGEKVKLLHTRESNGGVMSKLFNGAAGAAVPLPIPNFKFGQWKDNQTTHVIFKPDSCQENLTNKAVQKNYSSCAIEGEDTLILPKGTDIYAGLFTIEYTEGDLERSIKFRVPKQKT